MRRILITIATVVGTGFLIAARRPEPASRFRVTLERTTDGWRAECDSGCSWTELSVRCPEGCWAFIDADGVMPNVKDPRTKTAFGFVLRRAEHGWQAEGIAGTSWSRLGWDCKVTSCRVRLNDSGVEVGPVLPFLR